MVATAIRAGSSVCAMDFSGAGASGGEWATMGHREQGDIGSVVTYLRRDTRVGCISLWGFSAGAVATALYGSRDPLISSMVLDSPFSSLGLLLHEMAGRYAPNVPGILVTPLLRLVRRSILTRAGFDLDEVEPVDAIRRCGVPVLYCTMSGDEVIPPHHGDLMYKATGMDAETAPLKQRAVLDQGGHTALRPTGFLSLIHI
eukprot:TRINITY_DN36673_c0_g1_i2.p3 TRINITY_DN36673_c0_g1~~TRINITY_DN36673_c0_g1_i2.p3  ORF type:complete len:201 (+),score=33.40 TRINITY_DN36673_c0_g1_i2:258-860(+)